MNKVTVIGTIRDIEFCNECHGEKFNRGIIEIPRLSGVIDAIPVIISAIITPENDTDVVIKGEFRSRNLNRHCDLYIFAQEIRLATTEDMSSYNNIEIDGFICKPVVKRITPLKKEISDIVIATNRLNGKSDYIPAIAWGRIAFIAENLNVGDHVSAAGRLQSRKYQKKFEDGSLEVRTAYEVSLSIISKVEESEETE